MKSSVEATKQRPKQTALCPSVAQVLVEVSSVGCEENVLSGLADGTRGGCKGWLKVQGSMVLLADKCTRTLATPVYWSGINREF